MTFYKFVTISLYLALRGFDSCVSAHAQSGREKEQGRRRFHSQFWRGTQVLCLGMIQPKQLKASGEASSTPVFRAAKCWFDLCYTSWLRCWFNGFLIINRETFGTRKIWIGRISWRNRRNIQTSQAWVWICIRWPSIVWFLINQG